MTSVATPTEQRIAAGTRATGGNDDPSTTDRLLANLLTVDGSGTGLDADLLDGLSSGAFELVARSINTQTDDYTLVIGDQVKRIAMNKASGVALTVPPNASVAFDVGAEIPVHNIGAGTLTVTAGAGVTINAPGSVLTLGQNRSGRLVKTATNTWQWMPTIPGVVTAITQTFSTADATHAARTATALTVGTLGGTADGTMETVGATNGGDVSGAIMNNTKELFTAVNALIVDLADTASLLNSVIDALQAQGILS